MHLSSHEIPSIFQELALFIDLVSGEVIDENMVE
jgi:hypothetical protein